MARPGGSFLCVAASFLISSTPIVASAQAPGARGARHGSNTFLGQPALPHIPRTWSAQARTSFLKGLTLHLDGIAELPSPPRQEADEALLDYAERELAEEPRSPYRAAAVETLRETFLRPKTFGADFAQSLKTVSADPGARETGERFSGLLDRLETGSGKGLERVARLQGPESPARIARASAALFDGRGPNTRSAALESVLFTSAERMNEVEDASAQMVFMGPPYLGADPKSRERDRDLMRKAFAESDRVVKKDGVVVVAHNDYKWKGGVYWRRDMMRDVAREHGFELFEHKFQAWSLRHNLYRRTARNVLMFRKVKKIKKHPTRDYHPDVWIQPKSQRVGGFLDAYSPDMLRILIETFTDPGDLVINPFAGTATAVIMAQKLGRKALGYELDHSLRDAIVRRERHIDDFLQTPSEVLEYVGKTLAQATQGAEKAAFLEQAAAAALRRLANSLPRGARRSELLSLAKSSSETPATAPPETPEAGISTLIGDLLE